MVNHLFSSEKRETMKNYLELEPRGVFEYFKKISDIPRGSGNEKGVSDYIKGWAEERNLHVVQDEWNNLIIKKEGSVGYENSLPVILQGHMDMVCVKEAGSDHDFLNDPIEMIIKGDELYANGTTLGGDNGIAVAMAMAVLDSDDLNHPPLEVIFTVDEEVGMTGAQNIDLSSLKGRTLINIDSEDLGAFTVGSAGGSKCKIEVAKEIELGEFKGYEVSVKGLLGGHSGVDIHLEKGNAIKLLNRLMMKIKDYSSFSNFVGGDFDNAIPVEASVIVVTEDYDKLLSDVENYNEIIKGELRVNDPGVSIEIVNETKVDYIYTKTMADKLMAAVAMIPSGVIEKSTEIDLVITSNNLGVIRDGADSVQLTFAPRSSVDLKLKQLVDELELICKVMGLTIDKGNFYPGWAFNSSSNVLRLCKETYEKMYNAEPKVEAIHAGLECGFFLGKVEGLDAISIGPDMADIHTANEHLNIPSVKELYDFLIEVLKASK